MDLQLRNRNLQEASEWQLTILDTIGNDGHDKEIIRKLRAGESHHSIADWLAQQHSISASMALAPAFQQGLVDVVRNFEHTYGGIHPRYGANNAGPDVQWTKVSSSRLLVGHLLNLYFTWVHPVHMLFSEEDFKHSFHTRDSTHCSSAMVNAICAMACHLLGMEEQGLIGATMDTSTLRELFLAEARICMDPESYCHMTSVQAFAIMYLAEVSSGKAQSATGYLRAAVESLKQSNENRQSPAAREICAWGLQSLNT